MKAYQTTNTYNRLIEPDKWQSSSDLNNMTNLLKLLTTKNIKAKLGKDTQSMGNNNGGGVSQTFSFVVPYSMNHTNTGTSGTIKTAYPVKKDEASQVAINSLINATPLNS
ncbi:MgpC family cytadherence protein [Mycoplasmoides genitalium]|nr:MgpC family cytadherence protein [Mycoplasmoides genitalium]